MNFGLLVLDSDPSLTHKLPMECGLHVSLIPGSLLLVGNAVETKRDKCLFTWGSCVTGKMMINQKKKVK